MKKGLKKVLALMLVMLMLVAFAACGNEKGSTDFIPRKDTNIGYNDLVNENKENYKNQAFDNAKLIYRASIYAQSSDFDNSIISLKDLVSKFEGYFESSSIENGGYYSDYSYRTANFTIRVPSEKYQEFMESTGTSFYISRKSETTEDVGESYFDTEQKLATLKIKEERLKELLSKATNLSDIITLENELSDNEYEMNKYQGTLNHYDSLVSYATISFTLSEVSKPATIEGNGFFKRLGKSFAIGFENFLFALDDFAMWFAESFVVILIFAVIVFILFKIKPVKKIKAKITTKREILSSKEKEK